VGTRASLSAVGRAPPLPRPRELLDREGDLDSRGPLHAAFEKGRRKLEAKLRMPRVSTGDVVAAQTYWFWVMLLTSRFETRIWKREFANAFPCAPSRIDRRIVHE
jgi:hypothetical protein